MFEKNIYHKIKPLNVIRWVHLNLLQVLKALLALL